MVAPGQARVIQIGKMLMAPPKKMAAQTWMWTWLDWPAQRQRRDEKRDEDPSNPLEEHQPGEQPIRVSNNLLPMLLEQLFGALDGIVDATGAETHFKHSAAGFVSERFASEQPKTSV